MTSQVRRSKTMIGQISAAGVCVRFGWPLALGCLLTWMSSSQSAHAKSNVTETFDVGAGTRFETFQGNNPAPIATAGLGTPADMSMQEMGFGPEVLDYSAVKTNQFGLTTTNFVGQANGTSGAGEFGGQFSWFSYGYGADTNIGSLTIGQATLEDPIKIQATVIMQDHDWKNDETIAIGYFNESPPNTFGNADDMRRSSTLSPSTTISGGIGFIGDGRFFLYLPGSNSDVFDFRFHPDPVGPDTGPIPVDLSIFCSDCEGGSGTGMIVGTVNGNEVDFSRPVNSSDTLAAFGIGQAYLRPAQDHWRRSVVYVDDLTYTVGTDGGIDNPDPFRFSLQVTGNGGDYNGDSVVNAADYTVWRNHLGDSGTAGSVSGDGTGDDLSGVPDGDVDQFDYDYWKQEFGTAIGGSGGNASTTSVPEPAGLLLMLFGGVCLGCMSRRTR